MAGTLYRVRLSQSNLYIIYVRRIVSKNSLHPKISAGKKLFEYIENNLDVSTFFVLPIFFSRGLLPIIQRPFRGIVW